MSRRSSRWPRNPRLIPRINMLTVSHIEYIYMHQYAMHSMTGTVLHRGGNVPEILPGIPPYIVRGMYVCACMYNYY